MTSPGSPPSDILEGTLERVVYANPESGWSVVRLAVAGQREPVTAVGSLLEVQPGESLHLEGSWEEDRKFGRQFRVSAYRTVLPATAGAIEKYLGSGLIQGIGKVMAKRLVERFGAETLEVIEHTSGRLQEVEGIGPKRSAQIRAAWREQREIQEVMLFLQGHGVSTAHAIRIWKAYGDGAIAVVQRDPYRLAAELRGIGFLTADRIAAQLGLPADSPERAAAGAMYLLSQATERGHLYLPRRRLVEQGAELLGVDGERVDAAVDRLAAEGEVVVEGTFPAGEDEGEAVYLKALHAAEAGLAGRLEALVATPARPLRIDVERALVWFESRLGLALAGEQREAIRRALTAKVLVITGGPGTGKTTLVRGIVEILSRKGRRVELAAPTGRAAKRLAEATGVPARTLHRLLEFTPRSGGFERHAERPLEADLVIVDEASMLDAPLAYQLARALPDPAQLVLVGDVDQLPSVGPGNVLADSIRSQAVAVVRLTEIFRQAEASGIVLNAHRINRGEMPELSQGAATDFFFIPRHEPEAIVDTLVHVVAERIPSSFGLDPLADVQVLTPMNRGELGVENLNRVLRERLNPLRATAGGSGGGAGAREVARGGRLLRQGDKVMQLRNNYDLEVFNGDLGQVVEIDPVDHQVRVTFEGRAVTYGFTELDELAPAYACSIHKSQGSEYPCVVLPLHSQHHVMLERNLLYTAITRAQRLVVLVGSRRALATAVRTHKTRRRYTLLAERLAAGRPWEG